jgi:hypothetical protein
MLKKPIYIVLFYACMAGLYSCAGNSTAYQMDETEKEKQRGYHANEANKIIDTNKQNRSANAKNAEKNRQLANKAAAEAAREKEKKNKSTKKSKDKFTFY